MLMLPAGASSFENGSEVAAIIGMAEYHEFLRCGRERFEYPEHSGKTNAFSSPSGAGRIFVITFRIGRLPIRRGAR